MPRFPILIKILLLDVLLQKVYDTLSLYYLHRITVKITSYWWLLWEPHCSSWCTNKVQQTEQIIFTRYTLSLIKISMNFPSTPTNYYNSWHERHDIYGIYFYKNTLSLHNFTESVTVFYFNSARAKNELWKISLQFTVWKERYVVLFNF